MKVHQAKCLKSTLFILFALVLVQSLAAQTVPCPPSNPDLIRVPELVSKDGRLQGTLVVTAQNESIASRVPPSAPAANSPFECYPQWVRVMSGVGAPPNPPATK